jgi:hypothetical protein
VVDVHDRVLESLSLFWIVVVAKDPVMVKDANDVVRIHDASELASLLRFKLIDQYVHNEQWKIDMLRIKDMLVCICHVHLDRRIHRRPCIFKDSHLPIFCVSEE